MQAAVGSLALSEFFDDVILSSRDKEGSRPVVVRGVGVKTKPWIWAALIAAGMVPTGPGWAQQSPPSCEELEVHRQWDFWIGEWDVVSNDSTRTPAGSNTITAEHTGCVLTENWVSASGGTGSSINFFDAARGVWRQIWVAPAYVIEIEGGLDENGAMALVGELRTFRSRQVSAFRGTWTEISDGLVNQLFEIADPETGEWNVWFDGLYIRRE